MNGTIKWFSKEKGFGFITTQEGNDLFFHVTNVRGTDLPNPGDSVSYETCDGQKGPAATNIQITSRKPIETNRPYYGKTTYRKEIVQQRKSKVGTAATFGLIGAIVGGPIGGILGATIGAALGKNAEEVTRQVELTNPCIRCGGKGHVTSRLEGRTGFQCPTCKNFWKVPDHKLPPEDLKALEYIDCLKALEKE